MQSRIAFTFSQTAPRIVPKVLLPVAVGEGGKNDSLCQKQGYRGRNG
jgi:hypothetical protein